MFADEEYEGREEFAFFNGFEGVIDSRKGDGFVFERYHRGDSDGHITRHALFAQYLEDSLEVIVSHIERHSVAMLEETRHIAYMRIVVGDFKGYEVEHGVAASYFGSRDSEDV